MIYNHLVKRQKDKDPKNIVRDWYNQASYYYRGDEDMCPGEKYLNDTQHYREWLDQLIPLLPTGARILELGCGCGLPVAKQLAPDYPFTGVDLSLTQCKRARENAPAASILCADMTALDFAESSFDTILALFSIIHVPLEEQPALYRRIASWLRPGGLFMVTLPVNAWTGTEPDWCGSGETMYWSHADTPTYLRWLQELGFQLLWTRFLPEGESGFNLALLRKESTGTETS